MGIAKVRYLISAKGLSVCCSLSCNLKRDQCDMQFLVVSFVVCDSLVGMRHSENCFYVIYLKSTRKINTSNLSAHHPCIRP